MPGTQGRTYGGDPNLVHIPDHHRKDVGKAVAETVEGMMRMVGTLGDGHDPVPYDSKMALCPGCYMIALIDAAVVLAKKYGQPVDELGRTMSEAFLKIAENPDYDQDLIEEVHVIR